MTESYELQNLCINGWDLTLEGPDGEWVVSYYHHPRTPSGRHKANASLERREPFRSPRLQDAINYAVAYTQGTEYEGERDDIHAYLARQ